jgi:hypothetical protein
MDSDNFNLTNTNSYNKELNCNISTLYTNYIELLQEYLIHVYSNIYISDKLNINKITINGLNTLSHVFIHMINATKNINISYYYAKKIHIFYIEFINQIYSDKNNFLKLNIQDANIYIYKKTIFEIQKKKCFGNTEKFNNILTIFNYYKKISSIIFIYVIEINMNNIQQISNIILNIINIPDKNLELLYNLILKINLYEISSEDYIFIINNIILKFSKNINIPQITLKMKDNIFKNIITDSPKKFYTWLFL